MEQSKTDRGFLLFGFVDLYGNKCSIQKSSLATEDAIWLGVNDPDPKILLSKAKDGGCGWIKYPVHPDVSFNTRMHLSRTQVADLLPMLLKFVDTGEI